MSTEYPKIETLFDRDPDTHRVKLGAYRLPEFALPASNAWVFTEKVDGTNVRVVFETACLSCCGGWEPPHDGECPRCSGSKLDQRVTFGGRTDNAQMPTFLLTRLLELFTLDKMVVAFPDEDVVRVVLYGEGYGARIQKSGGNYRPDVDFRLFDALIETRPTGRSTTRWWMNWDNVEGIAQKLGIKTAPVLDLVGGIEHALMVVSRGFDSATAHEDSAHVTPAEGIVARTNPLLFDRRGRRVVWKLKTRDFRGGKE
jgi:hypothetical protein